ncbi:MAG: hypothetical protein HY868_22010 [Chloroflexi bacterium]|nr:hypothetical protein [Chloroflexota bacterium]
MDPLEECAKRAMDPLEVRAKRAMDEIVMYVSKMQVRRDRPQLEVTGLLDDVATVFERDGPTLAEAFVVGKREDSTYANRRDDLNYLVEIIGVLECEHLRRAHGGFILKKLNALRDFYGRTKES